MHYAVADSSIPLPTAHPLDALLPVDRAPVECDGISGAAPISLVGNHVHATGTASDGLVSVEINGIEVLQHLRTTAGGAGTARQTSLGVVRSFDIGACTERAVALPDLPAITIAWSAGDGTLDVEWECTGIAAVAPLRYHCGPSAIAVDDIAVFAFTRAVLAWDIADISIGDISTDRTPRIRIRARIDTDDGGTALHIVARTPSHPHLQATLDGLRNVVPLTRAFAGTQRRRQREHLALHSPDADLDRSLQWAVQRVPFLTRKDAAGRALHALAAIAVGDTDTARNLINHGHLDAAGALFLIVVARYHAATADTPTVVANWAIVERVAAATFTDNAIMTQQGDARTALAVTALAAIAATAGDIGRSAFDADVASRVKQLRIRHADTLRRDHWLGAIDDDAGRGWHAVADAADAEAAHALRIAGLTAAAHDTPARTILPVALGLCGIEPEAARNRLRIRPRFPHTWQFAEIDNIRVGDARVRLTYSQDGDTHTFQASQVSGGVPARLILEPVMHGVRIESTSVDGEPAELGAVELGGRIMVPVQLVLDETRRLEVRIAKTASGS